MKKRIIWAAVTMLSAGSLFAGGMGKEWSDDNWDHRSSPLASRYKDPDWSIVSTISIGAAWTGGGETETFFLTPEIEKSYVDNNDTNTTFVGEIFIGLQKNLLNKWKAQLGLALALSTDADINGIILDDADPEFDNHIYSYKVQNTRFALKGKLLFDNDMFISPWVSASVGLGYTRSHSFTNTPVIFEALPVNNFKDGSESSLNYSVGVGLQAYINDCWSVGIGYEFANWGSSQLERADEQTLNSGLSLSHFHANALMLNLNASF